MLNKSLIISLLCMLVIGCSSTNYTKTKRVQLYQDYINSHQLVAKDTIVNFRYNNWKSLDDKHLILSGNSKRQYLITLKQFCNELRSAVSITLDQSMSSRLNAKFDSVIVPGDFQQKCRISTIHQLDRDQEIEVLALRNEYRNK
jgi:hypothetical protein